MRNLLISIIDFFYKPFQSIMPLKTFRYAACGGGNLVLDICLYYLVFHVVLHQENLDLILFTLSSHIAALFIVYPITLTTGFLLQKYITFQESDLKGKVQFFRYIQVSFGAIFINYILMKIFVDLLGFYPTPSKILTVIVSIIYSYISQSKYSFKVSDKD
ncbi:GtrA family protein [Flammeovirga yaeyamensis]|uniref:GtrA family protein n=1 Tax=Flammeovirga yaeyamensis TaxID=367791 RepID=A0AAX1N9U3_9BACT|nr:GtrA family protein [Flammeovirga yaeyamensis]QWG04359.1 GtrA family protein [Flammeovirga yaeyamensis]